MAAPDSLLAVAASLQLWRDLAAVLYPHGALSPPALGRAHPFTLGHGLNLLLRATHSSIGAYGSLREHPAALRLITAAINGGIREYMLGVQQQAHAIVSSGARQLAPEEWRHHFAQLERIWVDAFRTPYDILGFRDTAAKQAIGLLPLLSSSPAPDSASVPRPDGHRRAARPPPSVLLAGVQLPAGRGRVCL